MTTQIDAFGEAKERAGGAPELARKLGIRPQAVFQWRQVPALRVIQVERITGVSRHLLRPDIYPLEDQEAAE